MVMCGAAGAACKEADIIETTTVKTTAKRETLRNPPDHTIEYSSGAAASSRGEPLLYDFLRECAARQIHHLRSPGRLRQEHANGAPRPYPAKTGHSGDRDPRTG